MKKTSIKNILASSIFFLGGLVAGTAYAEEGQGLGTTNQGTMQNDPRDQQDSGPYNPTARGESSSDQNGAGSTGIGSGSQSSPSGGSSSY